MVKKIAAHYVLPIHDKPIKNGVITYNESGTILEISQPAFHSQEIAGLEFYSGILVPGFVNTHCHLELSHMKSLIPTQTGLHGFVSKIAVKRESDVEMIHKAAQKADVKMWYNGIAAVGDISNTDHSFSIKKNSGIHYHTFLEVFSTMTSLARTKFDFARELQNKLNSMGLSSSIVPHAPYSVTPDLFRMISNHEVGNSRIISMHSQECASENELYRGKKGKLHDTLKDLGLDFSDIPETGKNSLESVIRFIDPSIRCILVHNTFSTKNDIAQAADYFNHLYLAVCPNANLYIENKLPDIQLFRQMGQKMTIGTDSLASNHQLSVLEELKTIHKQFPDIPMNELFTWATLNGAEALGIADRFGSFEVGKTPGINLLTGIDLNGFHLKDTSKIKRII